MRLIVAAPNVTPTERQILEAELHRILPSVKRRSRRFTPDDRILRVRLTQEGGPALPLFHLTLSIQLPDHPVVVQREGRDLRQMVTEAESALRTEMRKSSARIRKEHLARRRRSHKEAYARFISEAPGIPSQEPSTTTNGDTEANPLFARLRPLLGPLHRFAREAIRTAELAGEIPRDYLSPDDLIDQALVVVADQATIKGGSQALEQRLFAQIQQLIEEEVAQQNAGGTMISLDEQAPGDERWGIEGPEVEEREYHMPFTHLLMEDVLVDDHALDPESHLSDQEQHRLILKHLGGFHSKARAAFYLNRVEGFEHFEIAMIQNRGEAAVRTDIDACVESLRSNLHAAADAIAPLVENGVRHARTA